VSRARLTGRQGLRERLEGGLRNLEANPGVEACVQQYQQRLPCCSTRRCGERSRWARSRLRCATGTAAPRSASAACWARRLVEGGARFVLVDYGYDPEYGNLWDNHNAPVQNHPPIVEIVKRPWHLAGVIGPSRR